MHSAGLRLLSSAGALAASTPRCDCPVWTGRVDRRHGSRSSTALIASPSRRCCTSSRLARRPHGRLRPDTRTCSRIRPWSLFEAKSPAWMRSRTWSPLPPVRAPSANSRTIGACSLSACSRRRRSCPESLSMRAPFTRPRMHLALRSASGRWSRNAPWTRARRSASASSAVVTSAWSSLRISPACFRRRLRCPRGMRRSRSCTVRRRCCPPHSGSPERRRKIGSSTPASSYCCLPRSARSPLASSRLHRARQPTLRAIRCQST
mmetsp:Transcript_11338/g.28979  ORF Transcript_11338/g.28979 Transcript_11338/m.28979 type:complete len:263 (+) Transcript_11338:183-971(+)